MPLLMMLSRELRSVPEDFVWPLNKVWQGYLMPDELSLPKCPVCRGDGYSDQARQLNDSFYNNYSRHNGWHDQLVQAEVDHLLSEGRLQTWVKDQSQRGGHWQALPRQAAEVNKAQHQPGFGQHDGLNRIILVKYRCQTADLPYHCHYCQGSGTVESASERQAYDAWTASDPPVGDGIQLWETVSEGSPISPVFHDSEVGRRALAEWLANNERFPGNGTGSIEDWEYLVWEIANAVDIHTGELH